MKHNRLAFTPYSLAAGLCLAALTCFVAPAGESSKKPANAKDKDKDQGTGLVLHYSFDQADPAGNVLDKSGRNNHGRMVGAKWISAGKTGGGCELARGGDLIHVPDSDTLHMKHATFVIWLRSAKSDAIWRRVFDRRVDHGFAISLGGDIKDLQSRGKLGFSVNGCTPCLSDSVVADGNWHHAAATFDGENLRLYIDGLPQKQVVPYKGEIASTGDAMTIGMNRSNPSPQEKNQSYEGSIDEVMIYNRALTAEDIKALVVTVDPVANKPKFTKQQVVGRLKQLKYLFEEELLTEEFYARKVAECEAAQ